MTLTSVALLGLWAIPSGATHRNPRMQGRIYGPCGQTDAGRRCSMNGYGIDSATFRGSLHQDAEGRVVFEFKRPASDRWRTFKTSSDSGNGIYIQNRDRAWQRPSATGRFRAVFTSPGNDACHWWQVRARFIPSNHFARDMAKDRIYVYIGDACG